MEKRIYATTCTKSSDLLLKKDPESFIIVSNKMAILFFFNFLILTFDGKMEV
jgi:hypothetical protein